jgi:small-conductance mechanosensitive channel
VRWRQTITGVRFERPVAIIQDEPELLVEWEGVSGTINDIGFRMTTIKTVNNETVLVQNSEFATKPVTNGTYNDPQALS